MLQTHSRKFDYKIPRKKPKIFPPADSCAKNQYLTHYKNLTQQEPKTSSSAVTCSDEIQQKNLKPNLLPYSRPDSN